MKDNLNNYYKYIPLLIVVLTVVVLLVIVSFRGDIGLIEFYTSNTPALIASVVLLIFALVAAFFIRKIGKRALELDDELTDEVNQKSLLVEIAAKIGNGDYDFDSNGSTNDELTSSLLEMRNKLKENSEKDQTDKWISDGKELISDILRENHDLDELSFNLIKSLADYIGVIQGAFYIAENEEGNTFLNMQACYAYGRKKYKVEKFILGEGLVGQCAIEQDIIHRTEIPDNYVTISSGILGDQKPGALLMVPMIINEDQLMGVIELAGFEKFDSQQIELTKEVGEIIGRTIYNLKVNERTKVLLEESQTMTEELKVKQRQLEDHAVEMAENQELIEKTNEKLEEQITEVQNSQKRQHTLLENASEIIAIFDDKYSIKYESPSINEILGYSPEELIGESAFTILSKEEAKKLKAKLDFVIKNPEEIFSLEFVGKKKNGEKVWMEGVGKNLLDEPAIRGIVFNYRDITQRKIAEKEQVMRGKMQSLSENSQDLIIRSDLKGVVQYVNPIVNQFLHVKKDDILNKSIQDAAIDDIIKESFLDIIKDVQKASRATIKEIVHKERGADRYLEVKAIPELDDEKKLETVLLVAHDISERRENEELIKRTVKKITESINYAKRIQHAFIPDFNEIQRHFKDAFMWYEPKDVVSGDFPWFYKKDDELFIAAVDCTGHGVPGAMMSLIGYLLLNDIVKEEGITSAELLSKLHKAVVKTLKQDVEGNTAADGMDVAMCKINLKTMELQFSGAHRPLYLLSGGELHQFKGDKYPIGGNQHNGENSFQNHDIQLKQGDSIYFFSDGLPDQFGGPRDMKFGPKRIRTIIEENQELNMRELKQVFINQYTEWAKNERQLDDILLLGIRFNNV